MHGLLLVLAASVGVGLHVGETEHVPYQEVLVLVEMISSLVKQRTERPVVIDSADWEQCRGRGPCLDAVRARTQTTDVVVVRVFAGPLTLHVASERFYPELDATRTSSASLPKGDHATWTRKIESMVVRLFPELPQPRAEAPPPVLAEPIAAPADEPSIAPWIVLGASGAAAAVGIGFGISNRAANGRLEGQVTTFEERAELETRARSHGITATVLFSAAAAGAITAFLLYAFD